MVGSCSNILTGDVWGIIECLDTRDVDIYCVCPGCLGCLGYFEVKKKYL